MLFNTIDVDYEVLESAIDGAELTSDGIREINLDIAAPRNIGEVIFNVFGQFAGFLWAGIRLLTNGFAITASVVWNFATQLFLRVAAFDFGASDQQLQQQLQGSLGAAGSILGDFLGSVGVRLGALVLVGVGALKFTILGSALFAT